MSMSRSATGGATKEARSQNDRAFFINKLNYVKVFEWVHVVQRKRNRKKDVARTGRRR